MTQGGLIAPSTVLAAAAGCFALAVVVGAYLVVRGGWPFVVIGLASVLAGWAYTGGPYPLGYHGLGDLFVLVFFGLVAVPGTFYAQALHLVPGGVAGRGGGRRAGDDDPRRQQPPRRRDRRPGRQAHPGGPLRPRASGAPSTSALLAVALAVPVLLVGLGWARWPVLLALLAAPLAWRPVRSVLTETGTGPEPRPWRPPPVSRPSTDSSSASAPGWGGA